MSETQHHLHAVDDAARFTAGDETTDNGTTPPGGTSVPPSTRSQAKARPERPIPTDRLRFDNQLEVLKAVASLSGNNRKGVTAETMSAAIGLSGGTGGLNSRFFRSVNWFDTVGRGEYTASDGLLAYVQHVNVDPDETFEATVGLRGEMRRSWVWETVGPLLESGHAVREKAILLALAQAAGAQKHTPQLETIVEWLVWVGLVVREGESIRLSEAAPATEPQTDEVFGDDEGDQNRVEDEDKAESGSSISPEAETSTEQVTEKPIDNAIISFSVNVRLTAEDVKTLGEDEMAFVMSLAEKLRG